MINIKVQLRRSVKYTYTLGLAFLDIPVLKRESS